MLTSGSGDIVPVLEGSELYERIVSAWEDRGFRLSQEDKWKFLDSLFRRLRERYNLTTKQVEVVEEVISFREALALLNKAYKPEIKTRLRQLFDELCTIAAPHYGKGHGYSTLGGRISFIKVTMDGIEKRGGYIWNKTVDDILGIINALQEQPWDQDRRQQLRDRLETEYADLIAATRLPKEPPQ